MKANQKSLWTQDTRAQVGIGTMIVFIATILVAATAAAVLIDTSGKLQERSSSTGNQATEQVASNLIVKGAYGARWDTSGDLKKMNITIGLAPGASNIDLNQTRIVVSDGSTRAELKHEYPDSWTGLTDKNDKFLHYEIRDPKGTMDTSSSAVMTAGSLVNLYVNLTEANEGNNLFLGPRTSVSVLIIPEVGSPVHADFTTPNSFGTSKLIVLR